jgi:signal transduction histidine kinase
MFSEMSLVCVLAMRRLLNVFRHASRSNMDAADYSVYVARLAHDLRTVFVRIQMLTLKDELCQSSDSDATNRDIAAAARDGLRMLERYRFLGVCPESLPLRPHSLRAIRDAVAQVCEDRNAPDLFQLDFDEQFDHNSVFLVDLPSFREAIRQLLDNAIKFNRGQDTVRVAVVMTPTRDAAIHITNFADPPEDSFDRWIQPSWHGSNPRAIGLGMGLFVASRIAKLHNATLTGDIREGIVTVTFSLPANNNH